MLHLVKIFVLKCQMFCHKNNTYNVLVQNDYIITRLRSMEYPIL